MQYTRLADREQRNGQELGRKQVFLVQDGVHEYVKMQFSPEYAELYDKTLRAFQTVPVEYIGTLLHSDHTTYTLTVQYLGKGLDVTQPNLVKIVRFIEALGACDSSNS